MNKYDFYLIFIVLIVCVSALILIKFFFTSNALNAYVYYDNKLIKTIDLSIDGTNTYTVKGYNGDVVIETKKNMIRVESENSPHHICSKQGWVSSAYEPIVCLPNKIVIKLGSTNNEVDAVVR